MTLWSPDDPYGVATLRKVLLTLSVFFVVFGGYRALARGDPFVYYVLAAAVALALGLFVERAIGALRGRD